MLSPQEMQRASTKPWLDCKQVNIIDHSNQRWAGKQAHIQLTKHEVLEIHQELLAKTSN
jgi:hypothetical protein